MTRMLALLKINMKMVTAMMRNRYIYTHTHTSTQCVFFFRVSGLGLFVVLGPINPRPYKPYGPLVFRVWVWVQ